MNSTVYADDVKLAPYWWEAAPRPALPRAALPTKVDVAVVGSGYAGLSAALTLARGGRSTLVFEDGLVGEGASTRNGGLVGTGLKAPFGDLISRLGLDRAKALYGGARDAADYLEDFIGREGIDCHYHRGGRFLGAHAPGDYDRMAHDLELQAQHLGAEFEMIANADQHRFVGSDHYHGGALDYGCAATHPALQHQGLLERALEAGAVIVEHTPVTGIARGKVGFTITAGAARVETRDVVVATNGYTDRLSPWLHRRIIPIQSQMIATEPLAPELLDRLLPGKHVFGDTCRLHHYYRRSPDRHRILFGGRAGANQTDPRRSGRHLYRRLAALFPELAGVRISHVWTGVTGYTFDGMPHMGVHDGIHYAAGFVGSGAAMALYLGHKVGLRVLGSREADNVFDTLNHPTRPLYYGKPWFLPFAIAYFGWRDSLRL
jgi:glycine/D-amino acid oxidase-like deaminating enzyme